LAEKGYTAQEKRDKKQFDEKQKTKRVAFGKKHLSKDAEAWKKYVQAVADMKMFTYYPKYLRSRFRRLRAKWTYMNAKERTQKAFQRPKKWFEKDDYKHVQKQKVFGFTTSNGKICAFLVPTNYTGEMWAKDIDKKVAPFLKKCFPEKSSFRILLDGEGLLHKPVAKAAMRRHGIEVLAGWPGSHEFHNCFGSRKHRDHRGHRDNRSHEGNRVPRRTQEPQDSERSKEEDLLQKRKKRKRSSPSAC